MRIDRPFSPLEVGEVDNFVFDFTGDMGNALPTGTSWTCQIAPNQEGTDPDPQSHILSTAMQTVLQVRSPIDDVLSNRSGYFSVALVGDFPDTMGGSNYTLEATVTTNDGRTLALNATVRCQIPGYD